MADEDFGIMLHNIWSDSGTQPNFDSRHKVLKFILLISTHKTYKYVLINGLLGAAVRWHNPLVLQAQSNLERPWDARSVCHKVLVPFERQYMEGRLGNSNEPFLNKPARFPELSKQNAVRRGKDQQVLEALIDLFKSLKDQDDAKQILRAALYFVRQIPVAKITLQKEINENSLSNSISKVLEQNIEGEILVFCSGLILWAQMDLSKFKIILHPSNQSGASSKEIADIDIFTVDGLVPIAGIEVKDKEFSFSDFEHAKYKATSQGASRFIFVTRKKYKDIFMVSDQFNFDRISKEIVSIEDWLQTFPITELNLGTSDFQTYLDLFVSLTKPKQETIEHIKGCLS